jgi:hypothetical protein
MKTSAVLVVSVLSLSSASAQIGFYFNIHGTSNSPLSSVGHFTDFNGQPYTESWSVRRGIGAGFSMGFGWSPKYQVLLGLDILAPTGDLRTNTNIDVTALLFDFGVRIPLIQFPKATPYVLATLGLYGLNFKYGKPTIYIGPGGGYSSGNEDIDGFHLTIGIGVEMSELFDIHLLASRISYSEYESLTAVRLNVGFVLWMWREKLE